MANYNRALSDIVIKSDEVSMRSSATGDKRLFSDESAAWNFELFSANLKARLHFHCLSMLESNRVELHSVNKSLFL